MPVIESKISRDYFYFPRGREGPGETCMKVLRGRGSGKTSSLLQTVEDEGNFS